VPGELPFSGRQSVLELLTFLGNLRGGADIAHIRALASRFELDLTKPIRTLSKGNKQKVGLVQAFMHEPELFILDEPSSGLDPLLQREFLTLVRGVRDQGRTVFMSSHILAEVEDIADRIAVLREGRLVAVENVHTLRQRAVRRMEILFDSAVPAAAFADIPGVQDISIEGNALRCRVEGKVDGLIKAAAQFTVVSVLSTAPDLQETFLRYYSEPGGEHDAA
jgi:ABC-2 type transport system ATP-binding protein